MGITKALMTCLLVVVLTVSLFNHNVLTSGAEIEKISFDHCNNLCTDTYGWFECQNDCGEAGYAGWGECASRSPKEPKRCCCQPKK
ncbi:unnamed protein product [Thlaspi arvense]|uniref:Defensin-like domain-containing protein n=1 Tax=Thlaspi arvense TaxID=13288 RepID=A0AAU9RHS5_THLAR|nr:unnamed protein product [Thlaspi arvense]